MATKHSAPDSTDLATAFDGWEIRIVMPDEEIYLRSRTKPLIRFADGKPTGLDADLTGGPIFIDWLRVIAVACRQDPGLPFLPRLKPRSPSS